MNIYIYKIEYVFQSTNYYTNCNNLFLTKDTSISQKYKKSKLFITIILQYIFSHNVYKYLCESNRFIYSFNTALLSPFIRNVKCKYKI